MRAIRGPAAPAAIAWLLCLTVAAAGCELGATPALPPGASASVPPVSASATRPEPTPSPEPTFLIYQVRAGDALAHIARQFDTTVDSIGYWNRKRYASLDPDSSAYRPDRIAVGWLLQIHPGQTTDGDDGTEEPDTSGSPEGTPDVSPDGSPGTSPDGSPGDASAAPSG